MSNTYFTVKIILLLNIFHFLFLFFLFYFFFFESEISLHSAMRQIIRLKGSKWYLLQLMVK